MTHPPIPSRAQQESPGPLQAASLKTPPQLSGAFKSQNPLGLSFLALFLALACPCIITDCPATQTSLLPTARHQLTKPSLTASSFERSQLQQRAGLQTTPNQVWFNTKALDGPCEAVQPLQTAGAVDQVTASKTAHSSHGRQAQGAWPCLVFYWDYIRQSGSSWHVGSRPAAAAQQARSRTSVVPCSVRSCLPLQVSYFYDASLGDFYYGPTHPMKPHRVRMAHDLIVRYDLYKHLQVRSTARAASWCGCCSQSST
jgi:hypothetical protein